MNSIVLLAITALATLVTALALIREVRLRRALQRLLIRLLTLWRKQDDQ